MKPLKSISGTAPDGSDGSEESWSFPVNWLSHITNDHASASLFLAFDEADPFDPHAIEIQAGESLEDLPLFMPDGVNMLRVRAADGNEVPFRAVGVYRNEYRAMNEARDVAVETLRELEQVRDEVRDRVESLERRSENILERLRSLAGGRG